MTQSYSQVKRINDHEVFTFWIGSFLLSFASTECNAGFDAADPHRDSDFQ